MDRPKKVIVFDLNDVLVSDGWRTAYTKLAKKLDWKSIKDLWNEALKGWQKEWKKVYKGQVDEGKVYQQIAEISGKNKNLVLNTFHAYGNESVLDKETFKIAKELKSAGYRLGILANSPRSWYQHWHPFLKNTKIFEVILVSCQIGAIKPERKAFQAVLESFGVEPIDCLFIDDRQENVEAAEKFGMEGVLFTNAVALRIFLKEKKILPPR